MKGVLINKEDIAFAKFPEGDVLQDDSQRSLRMTALARAQALGNLEKIKVGIQFVLADHSVRFVETTVWGVGENHIMLKGGIDIPIRAIRSIEVI
jgi:hypothetical protein